MSVQSRTAAIKSEILNQSLFVHTNTDLRVPQSLGCEVVTGAAAGIKPPSSARHRHVLVVGRVVGVGNIDVDQVVVIVVIVVVVVVIVVVDVVGGVDDPVDHGQHEAEEAEGGHAPALLHAVAGVGLGHEDNGSRLLAGTQGGS